MANTRGKRKETNPVDETMTTGYGELVNDEPATETSEPVAKKPTTRKGIVNCGSLYVRKEPSKSAESLKIISKGTVVKVLSDANDEWYKVHVDGIGTGFCMKEFIKLDK